MNYQERKETARQKAIDWQLEASDWQLEASEQSLSYGELAAIGDFFYKLGKRYGLLKEFRENAIPC